LQDLFDLSAKFPFRPGFHIYAAIVFLDYCSLYGIIDKCLLKVGMLRACAASYLSRLPVIFDASRDQDADQPEPVRDAARPRSVTSTPQ